MNLKKNGANSKIESLFTLSKGYDVQLNQAAELFNLKLVPQVHIHVVDYFNAVVTSQEFVNAAPYFITELGQNGTIFRAFKDSTSLFVDCEGNLLAKSLILSSETVLKSEILIKFLKFIENFITIFTPKQQLLPDSISSLVSPTLSLFKPFPEAQIFTSQEIEAASEIIKYFISDKDIARDHNIIDSVIEYCEFHFKQLEDQSKVYSFNKKGEKALLDQEKYIQIVSSTVNILSMPFPRYTAVRAELAPTLARKIVESRVINLGKTLVEKGIATNPNPQLLISIMKLVGDLVSESPTLISRFLENGIYEIILKQIKNSLPQCETSYEIFAFISNFCLNAKCVEIEMNYGIVDQIFGYFTKPSNEKVIERWFELNNEGQMLFTRWIGITLLSRETSQIFTNSVPHTPLIVKKLREIQNTLLKQQSENVRRLTKLQELSPQIEKDSAKKAEYEVIQKEFLFYYKATHNFTAYLSKVFRENFKLKNILFEKGEFVSFLKLIAGQHMFKGDFGGNITWLDYCSRAISSPEAGYDDAAMKVVGTQISESLKKLEEILGAKMHLVKDFSGLVNDELALEIGEKGLFKALVTTEGIKDKLEKIVDLFFELANIHGLLSLQRALKPETIKDIEKLTQLSRILTEQSLREQLALFKRKMKEVASLKAVDSKEIITDIQSLLRTKRSSFDNFFELDEMLISLLRTNLSMKSMSKDIIPPPVFSTIVSAFCKNLHSDMSSLEKDNQIYKIIENVVHLRAISEISPTTEGFISITSRPTFVIDFYQEGGAKAFFEFLKGMLQFFESGRYQAYLEDDTVGGYLAHDGYNAMLRSLSQTILNGLLFQSIDYQFLTLINDKKVKGLELCEYTNQIWNHQIQALWQTIRELEKIPQFITEKIILEKDAELKQIKKSETQTCLDNVLKQMLECMVKGLSKPLLNVGSKEKDSKKPASDVHEKVVKDLMMMGVLKEVAELAVIKASHPNVGAALDWLAENPNAEEMLIKTHNKPETADLGSNLQDVGLSKLANEDFQKELMKAMEETDHFFLKNLFSSFDKYGDITTKITLTSLRLHEECKARGYPSEYSLIIAKIFRKYINEFFKGMKFIQSFKIPKSIDKNIGEEIIKSLNLNKQGFLEKLKGLDTVYLWFFSTYKYLPNFEQNILKSSFLHESLVFIEHLLNNLDELDSLSEDERKEAFKLLRSVLEKHIRIANRILTRRAPESKKQGESKAAEGKKEEGNAEGEEKKTSEALITTKKGSESKHGKKTTFEMLISLLPHSNRGIAKYKDQLIFTAKSLTSYLEIISTMVKESSENIKLILQKKIVIELMKVKLGDILSEDAASQISKIMMEMLLYALEDPLVQACTIENEIKHLFTNLKQIDEKNTGMTLARFTTVTKELQSHNPTIFSDVVKLICIASAPKAKPVEKPKLEEQKKDIGEEQKKTITSLMDMISKFIPSVEESKKNKEEKKPEKAQVDKTVFNETTIKLRPEVSLTKYHSLTLFKSRSKISLDPISQESAESAHPQTLEISPLANIALSSIIDNIVISVIEELENAVPNDDKSNNWEIESVFDFTDLLNTLLVLAHSYPVLIPFITTYDLSKHFNERTTYKTPILNEYKQRKNGFDFLSFYTVVLNYVSVGKLEHFLGGLFVCKNPFSLDELGETVTYDTFIRQKVVSELRNTLESLSQHPTVFEDAHSTRKLCAASCLLIPLLSQTKTALLVMGKSSEKNAGPAFIDLYAEFIKKFDIKRYYKLEPLLPSIFKPFSLLLQYSNYFVKNRVDLEKLKELPQVFQDDKTQSLNLGSSNKAPSVSAQMNQGGASRFMAEVVDARIDRVERLIRSHFLGGNLESQLTSLDQAIRPLRHLIGGEGLGGVRLRPGGNLDVDEVSSDEEYMMDQPLSGLDLYRPVGREPLNAMQDAVNDADSVGSPRLAAGNEEVHDFYEEEEEMANDEEPRGGLVTSDEIEDNLMIDLDEYIGWRQANSSVPAGLELKASKTEERKQHSDAIFNRMGVILTETSLKNVQLAQVFTELAAVGEKITPTFAEVEGSKDRILSRISNKLTLLRVGVSSSAVRSEKDRARQEFGAFESSYRDHLDRRVNAELLRRGWQDRGSNQFGQIDPTQVQPGTLPRHSGYGGNYYQSYSYGRDQPSASQTTANREQQPEFDVDIANNLLNTMEREPAAEDPEENLFTQVEEETKAQAILQNQPQTSSPKRNQDRIQSPLLAVDTQAQSQERAIEIITQQLQQSQNQQQQPTEQQQQQSEQQLAQPQQQQQQVEQQQVENNAGQNNANQGEPAENQGGIRFEDFGLTGEFLIEQGIDPSIFECLDEESKLELLMPFISQPQQSQPQQSQPQQSQAQQSQAQAELQSPRSPLIQNQAQAELQSPRSPLIQNQAQPQIQLQSQPLEGIIRINSQPCSPSSRVQRARNRSRSPVAQPLQSEQQAQPNQQPQGNPDTQLDPNDPNVQEFLDSLPENIRQEVLMQQAQLLGDNQNANPNPNPTNPSSIQGDMDPATFLATLAPDIRQEVLMTAGPQFLDQLPPELAAEAEMLRDRNMNGRFGQFGPQDGEEEDDDYDEPPQYDDGLQRPPQQNSRIPERDFLKMIKQVIEPKSANKKLKKEISDKLFKADDKLIESLLTLLYLEQQTFNKFPFNLLRALCEQAENEFKILETLLFLLKASELDQELETVKEKESPEVTKFPPQVIYEKTRIVKNKESVLESVSTKVLYLITTICNQQNDFFLQDILGQEDEESKAEENMISKLPSISLTKSESLKSISHYKNLMAMSLEHPLAELLKLCRNPVISQNVRNIELLVMIIENVTRNPRILEKVEEDPEETKDDKSKKLPEKRIKDIICRVKLSTESVTAICSLLSCDSLSENSINSLSRIILTFCREKQNLEKFISELKNLMFDISKNSNKIIEDKKDFFKRVTSQSRKVSEEVTDVSIAASLYKSIQQLKHEDVFLRISKIIQKLYETSTDEMKWQLSLKKPQQAAKKPAEGEVKKGEEEEKKGGEEEKKEPVKEAHELAIQKAKDDIVSSLNTIVMDENLTKLWINLTEFLNQTYDYFPNDHDINNSLGARLRPIIESFFIIHKILHDESGDKSEGRSEGPRKISISNFVEENLDQPQLDKSYSAVRKFKLEPEQMFHFMCDRNKRILNTMVKQNPNLLNDSFSIIAQKMPKVFDFEIRRTYFRNELAKDKRPGGISKHS